MRVQGLVRQAIPPPARPSARPPHSSRRPLSCDCSGHAPAQPRYCAAPLTACMQPHPTPLPVPSSTGAVVRPPVTGAFERLPATARLTIADSCIKLLHVHVHMHASASTHAHASTRACTHVHPSPLVLFQHTQTRRMGGRALVPFPVNTRTRNMYTRCWARADLPPPPFIAGAACPAAPRRLGPHPISIITCNLRLCLCSACFSWFGLVWAGIYSPPPPSRPRPHQRVAPRQAAVGWEEARRHHHLQLLRGCGRGRREREQPGREGGGEGGERKAEPGKAQVKDEVWESSGRPRARLLFIPLPLGPCPQTLSDPGR